jgi:hypothetical protein
MRTMGQHRSGRRWLPISPPRRAAARRDCPAWPDSSRAVGATPRSGLTSCSGGILTSDGPGRRWRALRAAGPRRRLARSSSNLVARQPRAHPGARSSRFRGLPSGWEAPGPPSRGRARAVGCRWGVPARDPGRPSGSRQERLPHDDLPRCPVGMCRRIDRGGRRTTRSHDVADHRPPAFHPGSPTAHPIVPARPLRVPTCLSGHTLDGSSGPTAEPGVSRCGRTGTPSKPGRGGGQSIPVRLRGRRLRLSTGGMVSARWAAGFFRSASPSLRMRRGAAYVPAPGHPRTAGAPG